MFEGQVFVSLVQKDVVTRVSLPGFSRNRSNLVRGLRKDIGLRASDIGHSSSDIRHRSPDIGSDIGTRTGRGSNLFNGPRKDLGPQKVWQRRDAVVDKVGPQLGNQSEMKNRVFGFNVMLMLM